jgi:hypothetical protein
MDVIDRLDSILIRASGRSEPRRPARIDPPAPARVPIEHQEVESVRAEVQWGAVFSWKWMILLFILAVLFVSAFKFKSYLPKIGLTKVKSQADVCVQTKPSAAKPNETSTQDVQSTETRRVPKLSAKYSSKIKKLDA